MRLAGHLDPSREPGRRICGSTQAELRNIAHCLLQQRARSGHFLGRRALWRPKAQAEKSRLHLARKITRIPHAIVKRKSSFKGCAGISTTSILNYSNLHLRSTKNDRHRRIGKRQKSRIDCELFRVLLKNRPRLRRIRTPDARAVAGWLEGGEWELHRWYCSMAFGESDTQ